MPLPAYLPAYLPTTLIHRAYFLTRAEPTSLPAYLPAYLPDQPTSLSTSLPTGPVAVCRLPTRCLPIVNKKDRMDGWSRCLPTRKGSVKEVKKKG